MIGLSEEQRAALESLGFGIGRYVIMSERLKKNTKVISDVEFIRNPIGEWVVIITYNLSSLLSSVSPPNNTNVGQTLEQYVSNQLNDLGFKVSLASEPYWKEDPLLLCYNLEIRLKEAQPLLVHAGCYIN